MIFSTHGTLCRKLLLCAASATLLLPATAMAIPDEDGIRIGGAVRVQYHLNQWDDASKDRYGDFDFELFRVNFDARLGDMLLSAEHRFYTANSRGGGFDAPKHAWIGYDFDRWRLSVGMQQVPFGLLPHASHSWWFGLGYYIGLEDAHKIGAVLALRDEGPHSLHLSFFKNAALNRSNPGRYSFDVITDPENDQGNEEINTLGARYAYEIGHRGGTTELGVSGKLGQLYNDITEERGSHWAAALHANTTLGNLNLQLQAISYRYTPKNPAGIDDRSVLGGFFESSNLIPARGELYSANIAYTFPLDLGPFESVQVYNNLGLLDKDVEGWNTSILNVTGALLTAGPVFTYIDYLQGRNTAFLGPYTGTVDDSVRMTAGGQRFERRLNINIGYYF